MLIGGKDVGPLKTRHETFEDTAGRVFKSAINRVLSRSEFGALQVLYTYAVKCAVENPNRKVITACAAPRGPERETWINAPIRRLYGALFEKGFCHTIEVRKDRELVGGLYGVAIGAAFFGESMFHRERDCSKLALAHLVARLRAGGYRLLDTQFVTDHLRQFGAIEIPRLRYREMLERAIHQPADFTVWPKDVTPPAETVLEWLEPVPQRP